MEAAEETLTYQDDTGLHRKLLPQDTDKGSKVHGTETRSDESNYVDLDMKPESAKTVKVSFTSNGNQLSVIKSDSSKQREHEKESQIISDGFNEQPGDEPATVSGEPPLETPDRLCNTDQSSEKDEHRQDEPDPSDCSDSDELQYTDMYLNSKTESDDGVSAELSDHCGSDTVEDESHYITTHEIQLTELDHDVDYDLGRGTYWDFEDDNLVYSFVDYASFESDETQEGTMILEGRGQAKVLPGLGGAVVSTEQEESDLCDSDKCASSDESVCKNQSGDTSEGKFHLSIQTSSRAVNDPVKIIDDTTRGYAEHFGDRGHFSFVSSGARAGPLCDRAQYFIPAPGRQHLATKLRRKDINEYSSGASSSISELDDADKEVRNLTAKSFRSLACPYFDAINLSTSSESSVSEYGLNKWSAYVDWNYGNVWRGREQSVIAHKTSSATLEMKTVSSKRNDQSMAAIKAPQSETHQASKRTTVQQASTSCKRIELTDPLQPKQRGVTLDLSCNVEGPDRTQQCSKNTCNEVTGAEWEMQYHHTENKGDPHKRAIFASSLLKNVISKKMQFEQERKMERGEICDTHPPLSSCSQVKDQEGIKERSPGWGLQKQTSEPGCGFAANSADDQSLEGSRTGCCEPAEEQGNQAADMSKQQTPLSPSQSLDPEPVKEAEPSTEGHTQTTAKEGDTSSLLFVPSCRVRSKRPDSTEDSNTPAPGTTAGPQQCETGSTVSQNEKGGKRPEIKICLRNVKENKGSALNIASLLTPKISYNTGNTFRPVDDAKWQSFSATDKAPNFTVRDIRDTKCKFQAPIYHVRDVRKLVKSSYRFVSLENSNSKYSTVAEKTNEKAKKEAVKLLLPSPIVIKCQSVKTNTKSETGEASEKQGEATVSADTPHSDSTQSSHGLTSRVPAVTSKQRHPDHLDIQQGTDSKIMKQRQDKFPCETAERRSEATLPKQAAIEKLKAAVKTMEQLYEFDRNEWKRKTHAPQLAADSHVLPLITSDKQGAKEPEAVNAERSLLDGTEGGGALNVTHVPYSKETLKTQSQRSKVFCNQSVLHFGGSNKTVSISSVSSPASQSSVPQSSATMTNKTPVAPLSVKIEAPKLSQVEQGKVKISPTPPAAAPGCSDYLTIPGLAYTNEVKLLNREPASSHDAGELKSPEQKSSPLIMEYPATSIYHQPAARTQTQQQVLCFSPSVPALSPTPSTGETGAQTQRKMLLDPTTGHYYLVDTPIQATTKRLFDPETGQYVDVPMPQSPVAPVTPVTPVPLSLPPLALSPAAYAHTYMVYPGFIPSPTLPSPAVLLSRSEDGGGGKAKNAKSRVEVNTSTESDYYSPTGDAPQGHLSQPVGLGHATTRGGAAGTERKPVISITTQQGPRIIAPPSFDGTTMSFVVEHR